MEISYNSILTFMVGIVIGFTIWFMLWIFTEKKTTLSIEKILWLFLFLIWVAMHIYGFIKSLDIPTIFDVVGAGSAGAMLGLKASDEFTRKILSKISK